MTDARVLFNLKWSIIIILHPFHPNNYTNCAASKLVIHPFPFRWKMTLPKFETGWTGWTGPVLAVRPHFIEYTISRINWFHFVSVAEDLSEGATFHSIPSRRLAYIFGHSDTQMKLPPQTNPTNNHSTRPGSSIASCLSMEVCVYPFGSCIITKIN